MKKLGIITIFLALVLLLISSVNAAVTITGITPTKAVEDKTYTGTLTTTGTPNGTVTYFLVSGPTGMTISSSTGALTWTPTDEDIGSHSVTIRADDGDGQGTPYTGTIFVRPDSVCEDYTSGSDIKISGWEIKNDDDDFYPGDEVEIEIDLENDGDDDLEDIVVKAVLYDISKGKKLAVVKTDTFDLDADEDRTEELTLEIPQDIDTNHKIAVFISAYEDGNDDENCDWDYNDDLDFKRRAYDIRIEQITVTPSTVKPGKTAEVKIDLTNIGDRDEKNSYIKIKNGDLGINKKSELFSVDAYEKGDDDEYTTTIIITIPTTAEPGSYDLEVNVYDKNNHIYESGSEFAILTVEGTTTTTTSTAATATITVEGAPEEVKKGEAFNIPVKLTNTASEAKEYKITVTNIGDWADSTSALDAYLAAGQSSTYYVTITPKTEAAEGTHSATILIKEGSTIATTKTLSFTIPETKETPITGGTVLDIKTEDKPVFQNLFEGTTPWIIGDVVLVIIALVLLKMLFSKKTE